MDNSECSDKGKTKRERSTNYTPDETDLLVMLVEQKKNIIEKKKSDATTWHEKEKTWKDIERAYNRATSSASVYRTHKHLRLKYEGLKRDIRKKCAIIQSRSYETGEGGRNRVPVLSAAEKRVRDMIFLSVDGNESCYDYDSDQNLVLPSMTEADDANRFRFSTTIDENMSDDEINNDGDSKEKMSFDLVTDEERDTAHLQRKILREELAQKILQRKILEEELEHKKILHDLEIQHYLLKIDVLKAELQKK